MKNTLKWVEKMIISISTCYARSHIHFCHFIFVHVPCQRESAFYLFSRTHAQQIECDAWKAFGNVCECAMGTLFQKLSSNTFHPKINTHSNAHELHVVNVLSSLHNARAYIKRLNIALDFHNFFVAQCEQWNLEQKQNTTKKCYSKCVSH